MISRSLVMSFFFTAFRFTRIREKSNAGEGRGPGERAETEKTEKATRKSSVGRFEFPFYECEENN